MAHGDPKSSARSLGIWSPRASQLSLVATGVVAWLIAVGLALASKGEAVATAFVVAGAPLIAAAAFYSRVRKVSRSGVEVDPVEGVRELEERLPVADDMSALDERRKVIDAVEEVIAPIPAVEESDDALAYLLDPVDRGVQSYERAMRLEEATRDWLMKEGYEVESPAADRGTDFIARRDGGVYAFEVKSSRGRVGGPTPEALHSYYRQARIWVDENLGQDEPFYRALITDVVPPPSLRDRYRKEGIGIVRIDPDDNRAAWAVPSRNAR